MNLSKVLLLTTGTLVSLGASSPLVIRTLSTPKGDNSYRSRQRENAGKSVYEIWWKGFNAGGYNSNTQCDDKPWLNCKFGNAQGIIDKLDYVKSLNVDYIWITPFFQSPQLDNGYDITDYYNVDPLFGTNEDFREILKQAHEKGLKVLIDLVMNHTSVEHEWFLKAIGKKGLEKNEKIEDFQKMYWLFEDASNENVEKDKAPTVINPYLRETWDPFKGKDKIELPWWHQSGLNDSVGQNFYPNNRSLNFNQVAYQRKLFLPNVQENKTFPYEKIEIEGENYFYLHTFSDFQPDLNWNNPQVRKEMAKVANFYIGGKKWLKGEEVDGFRFDVIPLIGKSPNSSLLVPDQKLEETFLKEFYNTTYGPKNLFTIGELSQARANDEDATKQNLNIAKKFFSTAYLPLDTLWNFEVKRDGTKYDKPYNFPLSRKNFSMFFHEFRKDFFQQSKILGNNSSLIMENHDQPRSVSRFSDTFKIDPFYNGEKKYDSHYYYEGTKKGFYEHNPKDINQKDFENKVFPRSKALATFKFLQPGIPIIYQGQEYSHNNYPFYYEDQQKEIFDKKNRFIKSMDLQARIWITRAYIDKEKSLRDIVDFDDKVAVRSPAETGRDSARTPIQWKNEHLAGWPKMIKFLETDNYDCNDYENQNKQNEKKEIINRRSKDLIHAYKKDFGIIYLSKEKISNDDWIKTDVAFNVTEEEFYKNNKDKIYQETKNNEVSFFLSQKIYPLILNPSYKKANVADQEIDKNSPLNYYRNLMKMKKSDQFHEFFTKGKLTSLTEDKEFKVIYFDKGNEIANNPIVAAYTVRQKNKKLLVVAELGNKREDVRINGLDPKREVKSFGFNTEKIGNNTLRFKDAGVYVQWLTVTKFFIYVVVLLTTLTLFLFSLLLVKKTKTLKGRIDNGK